MSGSNTNKLKPLGPTCLPSSFPEVFKEYRFNFTTPPIVSSEPLTINPALLLIPCPNYDAFAKEPPPTSPPESTFSNFSSRGSSPDSDLSSSNSQSYESSSEGGSPPVSTRYHCEEGFSYVATLAAPCEPSFKPDHLTPTIHPEYVPFRPDPTSIETTSVRPPSPILSIAKRVAAKRSLRGSDLTVADEAPKRPRRNNWDPKQSAFSSIPKQAQKKASASTQRGTKNSSSRVSCNKCHRTFTRGADLDRHKETVHDKNSLICALCGKHSSRRDSLKRHKRIVHEIDPSPFRVYSR